MKIGFCEAISYGIIAGLIIGQIIRTIESRLNKKSGY